MNIAYEPELQPELPLARDTLEQKFWAFHLEHPEVFQAILAEAHFRRRRGDRRLSMKGIYESLRASMPGMLNNSYTSLYTDLLLERDPGLAPLFQRRRRAGFAMRLVRA